MTTTQTVERPQPMVALEQANEIRIAMANVKAALREGHRPMAAAMLEQPTEIVARMRVNQLLGAIPRVGPTKVAVLIREAQLPRGAIEWRIGPLYERWARSEDRTLTGRQRIALAFVVRGESHHAASNGR